MQSTSELASFCLSVGIHLLVLLALLGVDASLPAPTDPEPITVELARGEGGGEPEARDAPAPDVEAAEEPPPPAPPRPRLAAPRPEPARPRTVDGVRLASRAEIMARQRRLSGADPPAAVPEPEAPAPEPAAPEAPALSADELAAAPPSGAGVVAGGAAGPAVAPPAGLSALHGARGRRRGKEPTYRGPFRADTPGWHGRLFGQVSVASAGAPGTFYGRIHLFPEEAILHDFSPRTLFGWSFRQELGGGAVREFETGRVQTHGAYLMVTDLFENGRLSTMGHTVILVFPREPVAGGRLYDVVEERRGEFRLRGPNRSSLVFDAASRGLVGASGFRVGPPGGPGTPPQISYAGLHLRLHAVGGNPFLRGRPATAVDARGASCPLSTSDLFLYGGRRESDMFRFGTDREFFRFLSSRCPWLDLPRPADPPPAVAERKRAKEPAAGGAGGLFGGIFGR